MGSHNFSSPAGTRLQPPGNQVEPGRVGRHEPEAPGPLRRLDIRHLGGGHVQHRAVEDAVRGVLIEMDLGEHLAVRRDHRDPAGDRRGGEQPAVGGEGHAVGHVPVGELAERLRLPAVVESADPVRHRLGPVEPLAGVEGDPVGVDARQLEQHLARAARGDSEQPAGRADVEAEVLFGPRLGEVQPTAGPSGKPRPEASSVDSKDGPFPGQVNEKCSKSKSDSGWPTRAAEYPVILVLYASSAAMKAGMMYPPWVKSIICIWCSIALRAAASAVAFACLYRSM